MGDTRASWVREVRSWSRTCFTENSLSAGSEVAEGRAWETRHGLRVRTG